MTEPTILLREASALLVREMMTLPPGAGTEQMLRCIDIADSLTAHADANTHLSVGAAQARMDVKSARQRVAAAFALEAEYVEPDEIDEQAWTPEDDRRVRVGQIADLIETMPQEQLESVIMAVRAIRGPSTAEVIAMLGDFGTEPAAAGDEIKSDLSD